MTTVWGIGIGWYRNWMFLSPTVDVRALGCYLSYHDKNNTFVLGFDHERHVSRVLGSCSMILYCAMPPMTKCQVSRTPGACDSLRGEPIVS
ncbi:hypothetical protein L210DRAFT_3549065 [Boletus edulis BED1]|uniref:Uncharacterized protein n=1 Tax=Boletus edulis BED1 TaxID=1328754 RepID=A0AAD4BP51_BOLED|nr:hypothetical protein L210DRAFT_3549065 [Boletus edulis BED1]